MRWRGFSHYSKSQYETALLTYLYDFFFLPIQKYGQTLVWSYTYIDDTQDVEGFMIVNYVTTLALTMSLQDMFRWQQQNSFLQGLRMILIVLFLSLYFRMIPFTLDGHTAKRIPRKNPLICLNYHQCHEQVSAFPEEMYQKNSFFLN